jgi:hypothetical protein
MLSKETAMPSKSERPESSVLLSLKELRRLEDERVKAEADARRAQAQAEQQAKAEAEQRIRDEETRRAREEEERRRHTESEREARQREDRLRVEEAERRSGRSAWMATAAGAALFLAFGGGLAAWASRQHQAEKTALEQEIARGSEQVRAAQLAFDAKIRALEEKAHRYLREAKNAQDQARILSDLQCQKQAIAAPSPRTPHRTAPPVRPAATPPTPFRVPRKPEINNEPLGGLPDLQSGF